MAGIGTYVVVKEDNELLVKITFTRTEVIGSPVYFENATDTDIDLEGRIDTISSKNNLTAVLNMSLAFRTSRPQPDKSNFGQ